MNLSKQQNNLFRIGIPKLTTWVHSGADTQEILLLCVQIHPSCSYEREKFAIHWIEEMGDWLISYTRFFFPLIIRRAHGRPERLTSGLKVSYGFFCEHMICPASFNQYLSRSWPPRNNRSKYGESTPNREKKTPPYTAPVQPVYTH